MKHKQQNKRLLPGPSHSKAPASWGKWGPTVVPRFRGLGSSSPLRTSTPFSVPSLAGNPCQNTHEHTYTLTFKCTCSLIHVHRQTHMHTHTYAHTHMFIPMHRITCISTCSHADTYHITLMHICMHMHPHPHHRHTNMHICSPGCPSRGGQ